MVTNDAIIEILHANHNETVQRLTRLETKLESIEDVPARVSKLENRNSWTAGVVAAVSAVFGSGMTILSLRK